MYPYSKLQDFCSAVFQSIGCSEEDAKLAAEVLVEADLRGVDSHGVARLSGYVRLWENGRINPTPNIKVVHETPSTVVIDGDAGLGLVIGPKVMDILQEKAEAVGTAWASVKNSNHFGIAGYHAMRVLPQDMIGIAMTNASPLVAPTHSKERMLGTNPIAMAIPAGKQPAFVADFATTAVANGKIEILKRQKQQAPDGWIQDADGNIAHEPDTLKQGGALLPLGSAPHQGSHKGYCLGAMVDILSGVLSGANFGPWVPPFVSFLPVSDHPVGEGLGHFFGAMRIDAFRSKEAFKQDMDIWIERFRKATPVDEAQSILIPGDLERVTTKERKTNGIPLLNAVEKDLKKIADKFKLTF
ncbi:Ldh family oxidoreductase [Algivirga pacifica]|uniref:Ldh family oxidoreductase n=1 Tax=Algivirga pacifica TaxID=1162670 RepID=A0ABP9DL90_9BACT